MFIAGCLTIIRIVSFKDNATIQLRENVKKRHTIITTAKAASVWVVFVVVVFVECDGKTVQDHFGSAILTCIVGHNVSVCIYIKINKLIEQRSLEMKNPQLTGQ